MTSRSRSRNNSLGGSGGFSLGSTTNYGTTSLANSIYTNSSSSGYNPTYSPNYSSYTSSRLNSGLSSLNGGTGKDYVSKYSSSGYSSPITSTPTNLSKKYAGSKTDTDFGASNGIGKSPSSWRSRSIDSNGIGSYRDHSGSRDTPEFSYRNPLRDSSLGRGDYRESSFVSSYNPISDNVIRPFSATNSALPLSPTARSRAQLSSLKLTSNNDFITTSILSKSSPLIRSNSFHELRDIGSPVTSRPPRTRHQTLAYGVSETDLQRAKSNLNLSTKTSSSGWRGSSSELRAHSVGNGYSRSTLDLGYGSQPSSRRDSIPPRNTNSVHVSFLSPPIESIIQLPSFSSITSSNPPPSFPGTHHTPSSSSHSNNLTGIGHKSRRDSATDPASDPYSFENLTKMIQGFSTAGPTSKLSTTGFQDHHYQKHRDSGGESSPHSSSRRRHLSGSETNSHHNHILSGAAESRCSPPLNIHHRSGSSHLISPRSPGGCTTGGRHTSCQTLHMCNNSSSSKSTAPWDHLINNSCDGISTHYTTPKTTANTSCAHHHDHLMRLSSSLPFYPPDLPKPPMMTTATIQPSIHSITAPIPIPDHIRSSSQLSQNLTASLTSLPASLPPYPSIGSGAAGGIHGGAHFPSIPPSYPSEISISSLPTVLSQHTTNLPSGLSHHTSTNRINPESLLLLKRDDLDAFLSKASNIL